jgi:hypothetical protein
MNQPRKPKKVKAPASAPEYLTAGKEYDVLKSDVNLIEIKTDDGTKILSMLKGTAHLDFKDWIVTEYEDEN